MRREAEEPKSMQENKKLYSLKELAEFLGCSVPTAQKIKNSGKIPYVQVGRKLIFETRDLKKALEYHPK
jgi:excisionase family DNA binding protein